MNDRSGESADQWRRIAQMHLITGLNERVESSLPPWCVWLYPRIVYTDLNKLWLLGEWPEVSSCTRAGSAAEAVLAGG